LNDLTPGKQRHLSRLATAAGHFVIMAIDHRDNLRGKLNTEEQNSITDEAFAAFKLEVISSLSDVVSGILTDPAYGLSQALNTRAIDGRMGLLAPLEVTDYNTHPSERALKFIPGWSVGKAKRVGCDGVKLLLYFHPEADSAQQKLDRVQEIVADCAQYDIPFFLEPIPHGLSPTTPLSNDEQLRVMLATARLFSDIGVDVLKLPFPVDANQSHDSGLWQDACEALDEACGVPWALLSAGIDFDTFCQQTTIACEAGASGVIAGRAVWGEAAHLPGAERELFLHETVAARMQQLANICEQCASDWKTISGERRLALDWFQVYEGISSK